MTKTEVFAMWVALNVVTLSALWVVNKYGTERQKKIATLIAVVT